MPSDRMIAFCERISKPSIVRDYRTALIMRRHDRKMEMEHYKERRRSVQRQIALHAKLREYIDNRG